MKHGINFFHYRIVGNFLTLNQNHPNEVQDSCVEYLLNVYKALSSVYSNYHKQTKNKNTTHLDHYITSHRLFYCYLIFRQLNYV